MVDDCAYQCKKRTFMVRRDLFCTLVVLSGFGLRLVLWAAIMAAHLDVRPCNEIYR
ncbi:Uncharacterised protein [Zhongshania aliphaticivorans]|uniref:Uncharacterized protein n=1 Tax=Zhongshania aliphaticivorans TaxID=1470434 RepID=A0A5S9MPZ4_9GAMM|nr:Uncharacterised protein [Zhongshania aliphaticivorans]